MTHSPPLPRLMRGSLVHYTMPDGAHRAAVVEAVRGGCDCDRVVQLTVFDAWPTGRTAGNYYGGQFSAYSVPYAPAGGRWGTWHRPEEG